MPELSDLTDSAGAGLRSPVGTCAGRGERWVCGRAPYIGVSTAAPALARGNDLITQILGTKDTRRAHATLNKNRKVRQVREFHACSHKAYSIIGGLREVGPQRGRASER